MEDYFAREEAASKERCEVMLTPMEAAVLLLGVEGRLEDAYSGFELDPASEHALRILAEALRERAEQSVTVKFSLWHRSLLSECVMLDTGDPVVDMFRPSVVEKLIPDPRQGA